MASLSEENSPKSHFIADDVLTFESSIQEQITISDDDDYISNSFINSDDEDVVFVENQFTSRESKQSKEYPVVKFTKSTFKSFPCFDPNLSLIILETKDHYPCSSRLQCKVLLGRCQVNDFIMTPAEDWRIVDAYTLDDYPTIDNLKNAPKIANKRKGDKYTKEFIKSLNQASSHLRNGDNFVLIVVGPNNVGKSTFVRRFLNRALSDNLIAYHLETDCGQTEFTLPGCLALTKVIEPIFGDPFTHLRDPAKYYFFGDIQPSSRLEHYLKLVNSLKEHFDYLTSDKRAILVVNTNGWISGKSKQSRDWEVDIQIEKVDDWRRRHLRSNEAPQKDGSDNNNSLSIFIIFS
uniref:Polyribonucleotide 5'-hydroxyl-kinase Clp1 P-loop domain-containing protein n=1 Tax=Romanomermis culicivorax TaxID=13658 RepID=A0A915KHZ1_ROMCU